MKEVERRIWVVGEDGVNELTDDKIQVVKGVYTPFAVKIFPTDLLNETDITYSDNINYSPLGICLLDGEKGWVRIKVGEEEKTITVYS